MPTEPPLRPLPPVDRPATRGPVGAAAGLTGLHVGLAQVDLTPAIYTGRTGYGPDQAYAVGALGRLNVTALVLDDGARERVLILAADLHSGSRWMTEHLGLRLAPLGLTADRIFFAAAHVHTGPGPFYGHATYDRSAGSARLEDWRDHFDLATANSVLARIEEAARQAVAALAPGRVGYGFAPMWRALWNRSVDALFWYREPEVNPDTGVVPEAPTPRDEAGYLRLIARLNPGTPTPSIGALEASGTDRDDGLEAAGPLDEADLAWHVGLYEAAMGSGEEAAAETMDDALHRLLKARRGPLGDLGAAGQLLNRWAEMGLLHYKAGEHRGLDEQPGDRGLADNRVHCFYAERADGTPLGAICFVGGTSTLLGEAHPLFSADAWGFAARRVERAWARRNTPIRVGYAGGALGDVNLVSPKRRVQEQVKACTTLPGALQNVREGGQALARATLAALDAARLDLYDELTLSPVLIEARPQGARLPDGRTLASFACIAPSSLAASEFAGGVGAVRALGFKEAKTRIAVDPYDAGDPQYPKLCLPPMESPPSVMCFRSVVLDGRVEGRRRVTALLGAPGEVSALLGCQIGEDAAARLRATAPDAEIFPVMASLVGDYAAYFGTVWEYLAQHYEGASTIFGRWSGDWARFHLARAPVTAPRMATGKATFTSGISTSPTRKDPTRKKPHRLPFPQWAGLNGALLVRRSATGTDLWASWPAAQAELERPLHMGLRTEVLLESGAPARAEGVPVNDRTFTPILWHDPAEGGAGRWCYYLHLSEPLQPVVARLRLRVSGRAMSPDPLVLPEQP